MDPFIWTWPEGQTVMWMVSPVITTSVEISIGKGSAGSHIRCGLWLQGRSYCTCCPSWHGSKHCLLSHWQDSDWSVQKMEFSSSGTFTVLNQIWDCMNKTSLRWWKFHCVASAVEPGRGLICEGLWEMDGGYWKWSVFLCGSSVRGTWREGSFTTDPEGYVK